MREYDLYNQKNKIKSIFEDYEFWNELMIKDKNFKLVTIISKYIKQMSNRKLKEPYFKAYSKFKNKEKLKKIKINKIMYKKHMEKIN